MPCCNKPEVYNVGHQKGWRFYCKNCGKTTEYLPKLDEAYVQWVEQNEPEHHYQLEAFVRRTKKGEKADGEKDNNRSGR